MFGKGLRLYKREKLCSVTAIDRLFATRLSKGSLTEDSWGRKGVLLIYPLKMVFGENPGRPGAPVRFLVSVPKKRLRHAVDRALMRRRVREAYRHVRGSVADIDPAAEPRVDVAFIYVADKPVDFERILKSVTLLMDSMRGMLSVPTTRQTDGD